MGKAGLGNGFVAGFNQERVNFVADGFGAATGGGDDNTAVTGTKIKEGVFGADLGQVKHGFDSVVGGGVIDGTGLEDGSIDNIAKVEDEKKESQN